MDVDVVDNAKLSSGDVITVYYNDVSDSVKYKKGYFKEFTESFIIIQCREGKVIIPRYKIIRIEVDDFK